MPSCGGWCARRHGGEPDASYENFYHNLMAKLTEQEVAKLKESLRGHLNAVLIKYPKAGPGILRKLWGELLVEKFGPPPKQPQNKNPGLHQ